MMHPPLFSLVQAGSLQPEPEQPGRWEVGGSTSAGRTPAAPIRRDRDGLSVCLHSLHGLDIFIFLVCFFFSPLGAIRPAAPVSNLLTPAEGGPSPTHSLSG